MRGTLKLADQTVLQCDRCGTAYEQPDYLWMEIGGTIGELYPALSDPSKTVLMEYRCADHRETYAGYTEPYVLQNMGDERWLVCLKKGGRNE